MLQNPKLNKGWWNSVALHVGSKNWVLGMKARGNRKGVGKVNVELTVQVICLFILVESGEKCAGGQGWCGGGG